MFVYVCVCLTVSVCVCVFVCLELILDITSTQNTIIILRFIDHLLINIYIYIYPAHNKQKGEIYRPIATFHICINTSKRCTVLL